MSDWRTQTHEERFWSKVDKRGDDECWEWLGPPNSCGRGTFRFKGRNMNASRAVMVLAGIDMEGRYACHHCDNANCVNPKHLYAGTPLSNMRDRRVRGRGNGGERNHQAKLTWEQVRDIRARYTGVMGQQVRMAEEYGVQPNTINAILRGRNWKEAS